MKLINAAIIIAKLVLSLAGIVFVINRISGVLSDNQYKFNVDSLLNNEEKKIKPQSKTARELNFRYLQNAVYESMDK